MAAENKRAAPPDGKARPAPDLRMFDCYTMVGLNYQGGVALARRPEDILAEMDRCGVDEALVRSDELDLSSPLTTNPDTVEFCAASERLHPIWTILPAQTGEMEPDTLFADMPRWGVKALFAWPEGNLYQLDALTVGPLLEGMIARNIPLMLHRGRTAWPAITSILKEFPRLTLICVGLGTWGHDRWSRPLIEGFDSFYIDTAGYELDGGVKELVGKYGAERILYASGYHSRAMGGPANQLRNLDIDDESKELIAHGNLERLLKEVKL